VTGRGVPEVVETKIFDACLGQRFAPRYSILKALEHPRVRQYPELPP